MSRTSAKHEYDTDFNELARLIELAKGTRSQKDFAEECGISPQHLCKCIKKRISYTPSVQFLEKIASHAANNVQLSDLLQAAGYDIYNLPKSDIESRYVYSYDDEYGEITTLNVAFPPFDQIRGMMLGALSDRIDTRISWTPNPIDASRNHFSIRFNDASFPIETWDFIMVPSTTFDCINDVSLCFLDLLKYVDKRKKVSFVTISVNICSTIRDHGIDVAVPTSVILIDPIPKTVLSERYLNTNALPNILTSDLLFPDRPSQFKFKDD